jgi:mRNA-degrading endonuclease toxin of MazEF toxin-antitoxin module
MQLEDAEADATEDELAAERSTPLTMVKSFERVDVTRGGRSELPDDWETWFAIALEALARLTGRRRPVVVLSEDAFALRKAVRPLRAANAASRPARRAPLEIGAYLQEPGLFGHAAVLPSEVDAIAFEADIKDASLATVRNDLLALGRSFRQMGQGLAADAVSRALAFVRRSASLPIGLREARQIADILHDGDNEVDISVRGLFRPKAALGPLAAGADLVPEIGDETRRLIADIETRVIAWDDETPVSAKLAYVLQDDSWNCETTALVIPDRRTADVYLHLRGGVGPTRRQMLLMWFANRVSPSSELHREAKSGA